MIRNPEHIVHSVWGQGSSLDSQVPCLRDAIGVVGEKITIKLQGKENFKKFPSQEDFRKVLVGVMAATAIKLVGLEFESACLF